MDSSFTFRPALLKSSPRAPQSPETEAPPETAPEIGLEAETNPEPRDLTDQKSLSQNPAPETNPEPEGCSMDIEPTPIDPEPLDVEMSILQEKFPDVPFPWEAFPQEMRYCLTDLAKDLSVPPEMTAVIACSVLSAAIGSSVTFVEAKKGYTVPVNLWVAVIAETGCKKTPTLTRLLQPVYKYQRRLVDEINQDQKPKPEEKPFNSPLPVPEAKEKDLRKVLCDPKNEQATVGEDRPKSLYTTDPTVEALMPLFVENPKGILLHQDEISGFLENCNKYRQGNDREQYLNLWSGNPLKVDRVGKELYCDRPFLTIHGGIQPKKATRVFCQNSFDDGMLPRFLFYMAPQDKIPLSGHIWAEENESFWNNLITRLYNIEPGSITLQLDTEAWEAFKAMANSLQRASEYVSPQLRVFFPKLESYLLKLTGILHMLEDAKSKSGVQTICKTTVEKASLLTNFFLVQARMVLALYGPKRPLVEKTEAVLIHSILLTAKNLKSNTLPISEIYQTYNSLVPEKRKIENTRSFGSLVTKVLEQFDVESKRQRKHKRNGSLSMHLILNQKSVDKLTKIYNDSLNLC